MCLGFLDHAVDVLFAHAAVGLNRDLLLLARAEILCRHIDDAVGIDVELDLDLGYAARCGRDVRKLETAEGLVARCHFALALQDMDLNARLIVRRRREHLALRGRDRRVALDDLRADATEGLDAERKRGNVEEQDILDLTDEDTALDRCADGDALIRVDALRGLLAKDLANGFLYRRDTGRAADEDDLIDVAAREPRILHRLARRHHRALHEVSRQLIELRTRKRQIEMLRTRCICRDERQVDVRLAHARKLDLRLLSCLDETLCTHLVLREVDAVLLLELLDHPVHDLLVEIIAAEHRVAVRRLDFKHALAQLKNGDIERAAAEVEDEHRLILILIQTIGKCRRRRLVDDTQHLKACDLARILRRLTLAVVEVCRHRDDRLRDGLAEICLCIALELLQNHCRDLGRRVALSVNRDMIVRITHVTLDRRDRAVRIRYRLILREAADETLTVLRKTDDRRRDAAALRIRNNDRLAALHHGDNRVRRAKINTNYFSHVIFPQKS